MADEKDVKNDTDEGTQQAPKRTLPPITSAKPAGGSARPLPPIASAKPAGGATAKPTLPPPTSAKPASGTTQAPAARPAPKPVPTATATPAPSEPSAPPVGTIARAAAPIAKPAPEVRKPKQDRPPDDDPGIWRMSRKNFLNVAGWFGFVSFLVTATLGAIRLMVPRVLYEPPSAFKAGYPEDYIIGEVNEKYKDEYRVWIVRETDGFYALSAICTHLGCTPRWLASENKFKCPCHGSGYHKDGINFEGPTPRPLERLKITLADDGQILVDRNVKFLYEKQEWSKPDAFLKYG
jgi:cytochrome b6-f complex iron-sulfur subunit